MGAKAGAVGTLPLCRRHMFREVPAADAFLLKFVLHDWSDAECVRILANARRAVSGAGRIFVAELVVPGPDEPHFAKLFDIHMMVMVSGRERTSAEYAELLLARLRGLVGGDGDFRAVG